MGFLGSIGKAISGIGEGIVKSNTSIVKTIGKAVPLPLLGAGVGAMFGGPAGASIGLTLGSALSGGSGSDFGRALFGAGDQLQIIPPSQLIAPPSPEETGLLNQLYSLSSSMLNTPMNQDLYNKTLLNYDWAANTLKGLSAGQLPDAFKSDIQSFFKEDLGNNLNALAGRGVMNSSVGSLATMGAMERAFDRKMNYLPVLANIVNMVPKTSLEQFTFGNYAPLEFTQKKMEMPYRLYDRLASLRYGAPAQTVVQQGTPGMLGSLISAGAGALGTVIGQKAGDWVSDILNNRNKLNLLSFNAPTPSYGFSNALNNFLKPPSIFGG